VSPGLAAVRSLSGSAATNNFNHSSHHDHHRGHRRHPEAPSSGIGMALSSRLATTTTQSAASRGVATSVGTVATFHSSPLSWFAAAEQQQEDSGATTDAAAAATTTTSPTAGETEASADGEAEPSATDITYDLAPPLPLSKASQTRVQEIFDQVLWLDMIEVHLLTQIVNEQMGIGWKETERRQSGGGGGGLAGKTAPGGGAAGEAEAAEEKTIFDLKLVGFDAKKKIKVIKEVRTIGGLGLKEAKEMVEGAPKVIQKELKQEKAEELKAQLEAVGAQVELV